MAFIVQAHQSDSSYPASITIERREDALETALQMNERGEVGVRIIGDGRIYNPAEFSETVAVAPFIPFR
jgi:hypothetical protein